jgi:predicted branched-subunit amino acid permease
MATAATDPEHPKAATTAFWVTGLSVYIGWNIATVVGALGAASLGDPGTWGLDAMVPAAFLGLLWPKLNNPRAVIVAISAAVAAVILIPVAPAGIPILTGGAIAAAATLWWVRS